MRFLKQLLLAATIAVLTFFAIRSVVPQMRAPVYTAQFDLQIQRFYPLGNWAGLNPSLILDERLTQQKLLESLPLPTKTEHPAVWIKKIEPHPVYEGRFKILVQSESPLDLPRLKAALSDSLFFGKEEIFSTTYRSFLKWWNDTNREKQAAQEELNRFLSEHPGLTFSQSPKNPEALKLWSLTEKYFRLNTRAASYEPPNLEDRLVLFDLNSRPAERLGGDPSPTLVGLLVAAFVFFTLLAAVFLKRVWQGASPLPSHAH